MSQDIKTEVNKLSENTPNEKQTVLPPGKESESIVDLSTVVAKREKDNDAVQQILNKMTGETISRLIDTIDKAEYDLKEVSVQFNANKNNDNLPICYMPKDKRPYVRVKVNQIESYPLLDSGAEITVLSYVDEEELDKYKANLETINMNITTVTQSSSPVSGLMWLNFQMAHEAKVIPTLVIRSHKSYMIVGIDFIEAFGIKYIRENGPPKQPWNPDLTENCDAVKITENRSEPPAAKIKTIGMAFTTNRVTTSTHGQIREKCDKYGCSSYTPIIRMAITPKQHENVDRPTHTRVVNPHTRSPGQEHCQSIAVPTAT